MAKTLVSVPSFTAGQLSPRMEGRTDFQKYFSAGSIIDNFVVQPHGPVSRRPGTYYVSQVKDSSKKTRLIPFSFSTTQTYIIELGDQYMRFYKDSGQITESDVTISGATAADPVVITATSHGFSNGDEVVITGVVGMTELNNKHYLVANKTTNTFEITDVDGNDIDGSGFTAYTSGGVANRVYEISTPYLEAELFDVKFAQSADVMYMCHPNHDVRKLTRTGHTNWTLNTVSFSGNPSPGLSGADNRPKCVSFFEQRLVFAGTNNNPQTLWFSVSGSYEDFTTGTADDKAMIYTIASNQVNAIESIKATRTLICMTTGGEFTVSSGASQDPITPSNLNIRKQSNYGSAGVDAVSVGNATVFLQRAKRKVRELAYNFDTDGYIAPDLTILSEDISTSGIIQMDYQQEPFSIVWCVRDDGKLVGMTYNRLQDVVAWHEHSFGGTDAKCKSVAVIDIDTTEDQVWVIVERTIDGNTRKYVEYLKTYDFNSSLTEFHFVDSGLDYSGSATTTLSGLDHLEGETVKVILNGATHPDRTVSGGQISLDRSTTAANVGLSYTSTLQTMRLDEGQGGTDQTKTKRIYDVTVRFFETVGAKVGPNEDNLDDIPFRDSSHPLDEPVPLFTGDKETEFPSDYGTDGFVLIKQEQALPMTILAVYARLELYET